MNSFLIDGTNFKISKGIYDVLCSDCIYFGFIKNNKPNISGFINHLVYHLCQYREDLHNDFLRKNNNDENIALLIEQNLYNTYLKTFDISNDSKINIQLRINKQHLNTFVTIVDKYLHKYNMDFTNYIRTLLLEYAIKPLYQREYFFIYNYSKLILKAQNESRFIKIHTPSEEVSFVPIGIEKDYTDEQFYIFGFTNNKEKIVVLKYSAIKMVTLLDKNIDILDEDYQTIFETMADFFNNVNEEE